MQHDFTLEKQTHAALAQYYRWYQVYEVPFSKKTIENQKDILADDVEIVTHAGTTKGKDGLENRLKVYEGWLNAHHVQHAEVKQLSENELSLEADIIYQNIRPDQSKFSYTIHYSTILQLRKNDLPVFTKIKLSPTGEIKDFAFQSAYAENRCKSFMYYWFYLIEAAQPIDKYHELLAHDFSILVEDGTVVDSTKSFAVYMNSIKPLDKTCIYTFSNMLIHEDKEDIFSISITVLCKNSLNWGEELIHETRQKWILINNKNERFTRMKNLIVTST